MRNFIKSEEEKMEPIRILHEIAKLDAGGVEALLMNIYRNIDRSRVQFDFLVHREDGFYEDEVLKLGGRIYRAAPFNPLKHREYIESMDIFFKEHPEYKILHAHSDLNFWSLMVAKKNGVNVRIAHSHNVKTNWNLKLLFMYYQKMRINRYVTHKFACSMDAARWAYGKKIKNEDVTIVKNGIMIEKFQRNDEIRYMYRKKLGLENKFVVGHVGRMVPQKNHDFILDVFNEICKKQENAHLILVGDGPLAETIKKKIGRLGLQDKVSLLGLRNDVNKIMQAMDIFLFPSIFEGLGIVALEAQAADIPIICSEFVPEDVDVTEYIEHCSLECSPEDWANKIIEFCKRTFIQNGADAVKNSGFDILEVTKKMQDFYMQQWETNL